MQLLQQPKVDTPISAYEDTRPDPSYLKDNRLKVDTLDYNDVLKQLIEKRAKESLRSTDNVVALIELADIHYSKQSYKLAERYYLKSLRLTNNSIHILRRIIRLYTEKRELDEAEHFHKLLLEKSSSYNDIIGYLNFILFFSKDLTEERIHIFAQYSTHYHDSPDIRNLYGVALLKLGKSKAAFLEFQSLEREHPEFIHAANNLGVSYVARKSPQSATKYFMRAIRINPKFVYAYQNLASTYLTLDNNKKALAILSKAKALDLPLEDKWLGSLAQLSGDINPDQQDAINIHENLLKKYPFNSIFLNNLGVNYNRQGKTNDARRLYRQAADHLNSLGISPHPQIHVVILNNLLELSIKTDHKEDASIAAKSILKMFPNNIPALSYRIRTLIDEHNLEEARELSERAYSIDKSRADVILNLSYIYSVADLDNAHALKILQDFENNFSVTNLSPFLRDLVYNNLAYNLIKLERLPLAKPYLDKAGDSPIVISTNALFELYNDNPSAAQELYEKAFATISDSFNRDMNILFSNYEFAKYYYSKMNYNKSLQYVQKGLQFDVNKKMLSQLKELQRSIEKKIK